MKTNVRNSANDALQVVLNRLRQSKLHAIDVETSGINWRRNHIVGYVVTFSPDPNDSYYVPFRHAPGGNVGERRGPQTADGWDGKLAPGEKELVAAIDRQGTTSFFHNATFDLKFLHRVGFTFNPRCEDTMINAVLLNEHADNFKLEGCAQRAKVQAKKSKEMEDYLCQKFPEVRVNPRSAMGHYWRLSGDDKTAVGYAVGDGTTTWQLRDRQMVGIADQELNRVWDIESRLIPVLARMTIKGIRIDTDYLEWLLNYVNVGIEQLKAEFPDGFSARSANDVRHWMEKHGHTDWPLTPKNKAPSFPESWLEKYPAGQKIIKIRKRTNLRDSFIMPLRDHHIWNGRVHTNYNQLRNDEYGTITGRLSSDSPNLQQVPKHEEELGRLIRTAFIPDYDVWGSPDFDQCEPRLLAYYSRCRVLLDGYHSDPPIDAHTAAAKACNRNWNSMSPSEQKYYRNMYAKRINQTIITGGGKGVLVQKYKVPEDEIDRVWSDYFKAMPEIRIIQKKMAARFEQRGYMVTLLGRRCRLKDRDRTYVALNRILQGGNADIIKTKMVEVDEYLASEGRPIDMLNNCHDAIDFQFAEEYRPIYEKCLHIMQSFGEGDIIKLDLPMPVDSGEGKNWAIATYGDEEKNELRQNSTKKRSRT